MNKFKKVFSLLVLTIFVFTLSGCFKKDEDEIVTKVGVIKVQEDPDFVDVFTFILELDTAEELILTSDTIDLEIYENDRVEAIGIMKTDLRMLEMDVTRINVIEKGEKPVKTKSYRSEELGISLEYNDKWTKKEKTKEVEFYPVNLDKQKINIKLIEPEEDQTLEDYLEISEDDSNDYVSTLIGKDDIESYKKVNTNNTKVDFYCLQNNFFYSISFTSQEERDAEEYRDDFYSIVDSLLFIPMDEEDDEEETDEDKDENDDDDDDEDEEDEEDQEEEEEDEEQADDEDDEEDTEEEDQTEDTDQEDTNNSTNDDDDDSTVNSQDYSSIMNYISSNINSIVANETGSGSYTVKSYEFVGSNYVYVIYNDGENDMKMLVEYSNTGNTISTSDLAYFKPGETKDWETIEGDNVAAGMEKDVIDVDESGEIVDTTEIQEGFREFDNSGVEIQYPDNWYYSYVPTEDGDVSYEFGDEPISEETDSLITMVILSGSVGDISGTFVDVNGKPGVKVTSGDTVYLYVEKTDSTMLKFSGDASQYSTMIQMAETMN